MEPEITEPLCLHVLLLHDQGLQIGVDNPFVHMYYYYMTRDYRSG